MNFIDAGVCSLGRSSDIAHNLEYKDICQLPKTALSDCRIRGLRHCRHFFRQGHSHLSGDILTGRTRSVRQRPALPDSARRITQSIATVPSQRDDKGDHCFFAMRIAQQATAKSTHHQGGAQTNPGGPSRNRTRPSLLDRLVQLSH
jgi:hypothetical protein